MYSFSYLVSFECFQFDDLYLLLFINGLDLASIYWLTPPLASLPWELCIQSIECAMSIGSMWYYNRTRFCKSTCNDYLGNVQSDWSMYLYDIGTVHPMCVLRLLSYLLHVIVLMYFTTNPCVVNHVVFCLSIDLIWFLSMGWLCLNCNHSSSLRRFV